MNAVLFLMAGLLLAACNPAVDEQLYYLPMSASVTAPPGCKLNGDLFVEDCHFVTADGRSRVLRLEHTTAPSNDATVWLVANQAALAANPQAYWAGVMKAREAAAQSRPEEGSVIRRASFGPMPPRPGAEACVRFVFDQTYPEKLVDTDMQGIRCIAYDPATGVADELMLEYIEFRHQGMPPDPGFARATEQVVDSVRWGPVRR